MGGAWCDGGWVLRCRLAHNGVNALEYRLVYTSKSWPLEEWREEGDRVLLVSVTVK